MRIMGIDPGFGRMGVALLETQNAKGKTQKDATEILYSACLETEKTLDFPERLNKIMLALTELCHTWQPEVIALERLFFTRNQKTAMRVAEVRGAVIALAGRLGVAVREYGPQEIKIAVTGSGNASKNQVANMIGRLIKLPKAPKHDDEYDAIAIALTSLVSWRTDIHSLRV